MNYIKIVFGIISVTIILFVFGAIYIYMVIGTNEYIGNKQLHDPAKNSDYSTKILIDSAPLSVFVARTNNEQSLGLSGQQRLSDDKGMLFDFTKSENQKPGFWMKGMLFDLDLIWIKNNRVVAVTKNVLAPKNLEGSLPLYYPPTEIDYVLEVSSGWSERFGVNIGGGFRFEKY